MRRRDFLALAGANAMAAFPRVTFAQQAPARTRLASGPPALIGALIGSAKAQGDIDSLRPFINGLTALGYVEGRDFKVEARYAEGDATRYPALAKELVALAPDLILASAAPAAAAAHDATARIPIV